MIRCAGWRWLQRTQPGARRPTSWRQHARWRRCAACWRQRSARPRCCAPGPALTRTARSQPSRYLLISLLLHQHMSHGPLHSQLIHLHDAEPLQKDLAFDWCALGMRDPKRDLACIIECSSLLGRRSRSTRSQRAGSMQLQPKRIQRLSWRLCVPSSRPPQSRWSSSAAVMQPAWRRRGRLQRAKNLLCR